MLGNYQLAQGVSYIAEHKETGEFQLALYTLETGLIELQIKSRHVSPTVAFLWGYGGDAIPPPPHPKENFEAKVLNFAVLSFGPRILSFSFKF